METEVLKVDVCRIDWAKIVRAAAVVNSGGLVAFPTETVYGIACRVKNEALAGLNNLKVRAPEKRYSVHIGDKDEVSRYVPAIGLRAKKLVEKAWPGPLTIVFELDQEDMDKQQKSLENEVFENLYRGNSIGIRCPDHRIGSMLLREVGNPVVAPSANVTGQRPAVEAAEVVAQFWGQIDMVVDGGPCRYKKSSTVVKIDKQGLKILRPGVYSAEQLEALSQVKFLFVCTGNTCRSPMAVGIFRKYLAKKLECGVDELDKKGYKFISAGVVGLSGLPASQQAIASCSARGIDITGHRSQGLTRQLIEDSDFIYVMDSTHRERVLELSGEAADRCELLAENQGIADPLGQGSEFYNRCAGLIEEAIRKRISRLAI